MYRRRVPIVELAKLMTLMPDYSTTYDPDQDFDRWYTIATAASIQSRLSSTDGVLELGCATGLMTELLAPFSSEIVGVDRSREYLDRARQRNIPNATFHEADIVDFGDGRHFDHVVATNVLHEVPDAELFLSRCLTHLAPRGRLHVSLQNPYSIHRLAGFEMGLIDDVLAISERGMQFDTLRMMDRSSLEEVFARAGFRIVSHEGVMLKPAPNAQMALLPDEVLHGFIAVAKHFPDHSAMNYFELEVVTDA